MRKETQPPSGLNWYNSDAFSVHDPPGIAAPRSDLKVAPSSNSLTIKGSGLIVLIRALARLVLSEIRKHLHDFSGFSEYSN
jgi:hypothetical protein